MDPTFTPAEVQNALARLRAGEAVPGWTYTKTDPGWGFQNDNEVWNPGGESIHYDISPTRRQGYSLEGTPTTPVFNPGEGYRRSVKYVEPLALAAFGTALGYGLTGGFGSAAGTTSGGSTLGSLGNVTALGTPAAELGAAGGLSTSAAGALPGIGASAGVAGGGGVGTGIGSTLGKMAGGKMFEFLIPAAAQLIGTGMQASAASKAAAASGAAADRATALQERIYQESIARQQPFLAGGTEDYNRLRAMMSGGPEAAQNFLQMDPGYQFRLSEGLKSLDRQAAARGGLISGGALKAAQRYGQDVASQEFGSAYNRLANLANLGPQAAGVMSNLGQNYAGNVGNIMMSQGQTAANAALARGSAHGQGLNQLGYLAGRYYGQPGGGGGMPATGGIPTGMLPGGYEFPG